MKKIGLGLLSLLFVVLLSACGGGTDYSGTFEGYSWQGEASGVAFEDSRQRVKTTITLDRNGIITAAEVDFIVLRDGQWVSRADRNVTGSVDFSVDPVIADPRIDGRSEGTSMFDIQAVDMMSLYTVAVAADGTVAFGLVCPTTRYFFEMKLGADFDFSTPIRDITIASGHLVPTSLTSGASFTRPATWEAVENRHLLNMHFWSNVIHKEGVFENIDADSTIQSLLEAAGVTFANGTAQEKAVTFDFFGLGGWYGNLNAMAEYLVGQDAKTFTGIVDWTEDKYALAINENNIFGVDTPAGSTRTVQNSMDKIAGATVRVSREATSIQRALVAAGLLDESQVIIGRF